MSPAELAIQRATPIFPMTLTGTMTRRHHDVAAEVGLTGPTTEAGRHDHASCAARPLGRGAELASLAVVLALGTILRFTQIAGQSLWLDEGFTLEYARTASVQHVLRDMSDCRSTECLSPLYPVLLHTAIQWLGDSVFVLRGFSALCGVGAVVAMIGSARTLFNGRTAVLAGGLTSMSAYAVWYSQDARAYSLSLLLGAAQLYGFALCLKNGSARPSWHDRLWLAVIVGLGILSNILSSLGTIALCVAHLTVTKDPRRWWAVWWPSALAGSLTVLVFLMAKAGSGATATQVVTPLAQNGLMNFVYALYGQVVGITFGPPQAALRGADKVQVLREHIPALACAGFLALLVGIAVVTARRHPRSSDQRWLRAEILLRSVVIAAVLATLVAVATTMNWQPRHSYFLFPPAVLLFASSVHELAVAGAPVNRLVAVLAVILFCVTNVWSLRNYFTDPAYGKDDYRGVATYLAGENAFGQRSALVSGHALLLRYYGDTTTVDLTAVKDEDLLRRLRQVTGRAGRALIAVNREFSWRGGVGLAAVVDSTFAVRRIRRLQYFDVYQLTNRH